MIDNYNDLTLDKYYELQDIDKDGDDIDMIVEAVSILSDMEISEVLNLPLPQFNHLAQKLEFLHKPPMLMKKLPDKIVINGKRYEILKDATKMTAGQYIDYKSYAKDYDSIYKNLPLILTTVIVPEGKKYGEDYDTFELSNEFKKHINVILAISVSNFFFALSQNYSESILIYLEMKMRKMKRMEKNKEVRKKMTEAIQASRYLRNSLKNGYGLTGQSELGKSMDAFLKMSLSLE